MYLIGFSLVNRLSALLRIGHYLFIGNDLRCIPEIRKEESTYLHFNLWDCWFIDRHELQSIRNRCQIDLCWRQVGKSIYAS